MENATKILCVHIPVQFDWNSGSIDKKKEEVEKQVKELIPDTWKVLVLAEPGQTEYKFEQLFLD